MQNARLQRGSQRTPNTRRTARLAGEKVGAFDRRAYLKGLRIRQDNRGHRMAKLISELLRLIPKKGHGCHGMRS
jgi:hypothetical protein